MVNSLPSTRLLTPTPIMKTITALCLTWLRSLCLLYLVASGLGITSTAGADTIALSFSGNRGESSMPDASFGWQFTLNDPVLVTQLGVWDGLRRFGPPQGGLGESHTVTIWDLSGIALAQATVPVGMTATLVDDFRYVSLASPVSLAPGTYIIGAYYAGTSPTPDGAAFFANGLTTASEVSYNAGVMWDGSGAPNTAPTEDADGYFGPNFQFTAVPESSASILVIFGAILLLGTGLNRNPNKIPR